MMKFDDKTIVIMEGTTKNINASVVEFNPQVSLNVNCGGNRVTLLYTPMNDDYRAIVYGRVMSSKGPRRVFRKEKT